MKYLVQKTFLSFLLLPLVLSGCGATTAGPTQEELSKPITLNYWRLYDDPSSVQPLIAAYQAAHPNVTVRLRQLRSEEYETLLLGALAEDRGPDIISLPAGWLSKYQSKLAPMPASIKQTVVEMKSDGVEETKIYSQNVLTLPTLQSLSKNWVDLVPRSVVREGKVMGLPLGMDSLALFYNREMFNGAGLVAAPATWEEFKSAIKKLTITNKKGDLLQSGVAMGTGTNVTRAFDLVSALMMQSGVQMALPGRVTFGLVNSGQEFSPAVDALRFYTDFANPTKETYGWNASYPESLQAFAQGQTAMFFGYSYHVAQIKALNPNLNFATAPFPQIDGSLKPVNYGFMFIEAVSKKSKNQDAAWDFLTFASDAKNVTKYLQAAQKPTVLRSLLSQQMADDTVGPFAAGALTAQDWYQGYDQPAAERSFVTMIDDFLRETKDAAQVEIVSRANRQVQQTYETPVQ